MVTNTFTVLMTGASLIASTYLRPAVATEFRELCGCKKAKKVFDVFLETLQVRIAVVSKNRKSAARALQIFEDAWLSELVWRRFEKFTRSTTPESTEAMRDAILRATRGMVAGITDEEFAGWAIESRGYLTERRDDVVGSGCASGRHTMS